MRLKNPLFRVAALADLVAIVYTIAAMFGFTLPFAQDEVLHLLGLVLGVLTMLGILQDGTTPGLGDSERALGYDLPGHCAGE